MKVEDNTHTLTTSERIFPFLIHTWYQSSVEEQNSQYDDNELKTVDYTKIDKEKEDSIRPTSPCSYFMRLDSLDRVNSDWKEERIGLTKLYKHRYKLASKRRKKYQLLT